MVPASPLRHLLTIGLVFLGGALLWATRPRQSVGPSDSDAKSVSCLNHLREIGRAYAHYARDFDGKIPLAIDPEDRFNPQIWTSQATRDTPFETYLQNAPFLHVVLRPYLESAAVFQCPSDIGWKVSRLAQPDPATGGTIGLKNVSPTSFRKYGTSYYAWTIYGFNLLTSADVPRPDRKTVLFDGDLWHGTPNQPRGGELFLDGHAALLTKEQHEAAAPKQDRNGVLHLQWED